MSRRERKTLWVYVLARGNAPSVGLQAGELAKVWFAPDRKVVVVSPRRRVVPAELCQGGRPFSHRNVVAISRMEGRALRRQREVAHA